MKKWNVEDASRVENRKLEPNGLSIVIPVFNRGSNATRTMSSIFSQNYTREYPIELIVVNDGSTDNSRDEICKFVKCAPKWASVKIVDTPNAIAKWSSPSIPYNYGLKQVKHNYVAHCGADSMWLKQDMLNRVFDYIDVDIYLIFKMRKIPVANLDVIDINNVFETALNASIDDTQSAFPWVAITSYDALNRIGFYTGDYSIGPGEDSELLRKLFALNVKFRILDSLIAIQEHTNKCSGGHLHHKNISIAISEENKLLEKIKMGIVKRYD